ncbi:histidine kinase N-terminal 7TM domain-containing protein [Halobaculum limi]|uniref:histidine kinase N-terminal 7TM domain-containing protein n=1 Tax=Halobaculum limi TaxID=3031916 RepID=UPI002404EFE6|nr:histidine kinase N-terminal 7TM domain-containing protein [Halobaculum sp. YSMS11]
MVYVFPSGTLAAVMFVTIVVGMTAALLAWRERPEPGAVPLAAMLAGQVWWSVFFVFELRADSLAAKVFYSDIQWVGVVVIPVAWFLFALEYTGRNRYVQPKYIALLLVVPAITVVLALTDNYHELLYVNSTITTEGSIQVLQRTGGPWYWVIAGYTYLLGLFGSIPLLGLVRSDALPFRGQSLGLLVGTMAPWASNALFLAGAVPVPGLDPTPVFFTVSGVAYLGAITRFRLLGTSPSANHRARRLVFERMREGAVVIDRHDYVVDMNEEATAVLSVSSREALGRPAAEVIPNYDRLPEEGRASRHLAEGEGIHKRQFDANVTAVTDFHGRSLGRVISFHDVSDHLRRQQRLEVLNRVLRHNIRTETNLIYGHADLADNGDTERISAVKEGALRIESISDKARDAIDVFEHGRNPKTPIQATAVVAEAVDAVRTRYPDVEYDIDIDVDGARVSPVLTAVYENVIENAAEHNTAADPHVAVSAVATDGHVRVRVRDNGPGIEAHEQAVLERGTETALDHGSGLGLWLIAWGTDMADGELTIVEADGDGTEVTVTVPDLAADAEVATASATADD